VVGKYAAVSAFRRKKMFGNNKIEKVQHDEGMELRVVEGSPFLTIQGEGPYTGHPAVFVRLHGCHLRCVFCDTDFDAPNDPTWIIYDLVAAIMRASGQARLVVLTGGEPMRQNILPLCQQLHGNGYRVQIETAGTFWLEGIERYTDIVVSPKTPTIHDKVYQHARAFKYVISTGQIFDDSYPIPITATQPGARPNRLALPRSGAAVFLSPMDEGNETANAANRKLVGELAIRFGVIAGIQLHKFIGVA
jgi:organic radical activating enzyme